MNDALRAKSRPLPPEKGTRIPPTGHLSTACVRCGGTALLCKEWTPRLGLDPDLYRFRCSLGHLTYQVIKRHHELKPTLPLL